MSESTSAAPGKKRRILLAVLAALGLVVAVLVIQWVVVGRHIQKTTNAYLQADAVVIAPKVAGYVSKVRVGDNQAVVAGQPLVTIDAAPYQAAYDLAEAQVAERRADLVRFRADVSRQQAATAEADAQVKVANAAATVARLDAGRYERLAVTGAETVQKRDAAASEREIASGRLAAARAAAQSASREGQSLQAQIGQGEAALNAALARARAAAEDLKGAELASPIAGVIGDRTVRVGQYVQPGSRLMSVVPTGEIFLVANYKETQLRGMRVGQKVKVHVDALPDAEIEGVVESVAPGTGAQFALLPPENATGNFTKIVQRVPVRIRLQPDARQRALLRPGLSAEAAVDTRTQSR